MEYVAGIYYKLIHVFCSSFRDCVFKIIMVINTQSTVSCLIIRYYTTDALSVLMCKYSAITTPPPLVQGTQLYSCDCFGVVLQWDIRTHSSTGGWELGPYAVNSLAIDPAGKALIVMSQHSKYLSPLSCSHYRGTSLLC